mmetsp:Transcript_24214/g.46487  ORF Transcript_24214/g.46487 Transcript_24214/m.46487 type:complete len:429 (+) Transcript_24214:90-1376(+)
MKAFFLPSPASTAASPSDFQHRDSDSSDGFEYQHMPVTAAPDEQTLSAAKLPMLRPKAVLKLALGLILLVASTLVCATLWHPNMPQQPRIWNPDLRVEFSTEPLAKSVIRKFDGYNMARGGRDDPVTFWANVQQYMTPDLVYESVGFGTWQTPQGWAQGEEHKYGMTFPETVFTQMLFFGDQQVATTTTYGSALWKGNFMGMRAPQQWVNLRITDFYSMREESPGYARIHYNFMMIDWVDALRQVECRMLPPAPLQEGLVLPPAANDGVPAPLSVLVQAQARNASKAQAVAEAALQHDWAGNSNVAAGWWNNLTFYGPGGIGVARTLESYHEHVLRPFRASFVNRTATVDLSTCEGNYCGLFGRFSGQGIRKWLGLPTTGRSITFRFAMHYRVVAGKVQEGWAIFDFPGLFTEVGLDFWALAASGGRL